jgi:hypothetical protein
VELCYNAELSLLLACAEKVVLLLRTLPKLGKKTANSILL